MARSLFQLVQIEAEIGKIVRMVLCFHPLFTVASLIFRINNLLDYLSTEGANNLVDRIVKMMSYLRQSLNGYWQSTRMIALRDAVAAKMKTPSEALKKQLHKEAAKGYPKVMLIGKFALFSAILFLQDTKLISTYDKNGSKILYLSSFPCLVLLIFPGLISHRYFGVLRTRAAWKVNATSNFSCFILALVFEKFYEKSWRSLSAGFCFAVYFLSLLVILRPLIDFGFFGLIMGVIGSISYNCFGFKVATWVVACICFVLFSFKSWLDKYWLELEEDPSLSSTTFTTVNAGMVLSSPASIAFVTTSLNAVVDLRELDYKDYLLRVISGVIVCVFCFFLVWFLFRNVDEILGKDHLPFSRTVKRKDRQDSKWATYFWTLDCLFFGIHLYKEYVSDKTNNHKLFWRKFFWGA